MIFDISDSGFKNICGDRELFLPIDWDGRDIVLTLKELFKRYISDLEKNVTEKTHSHISVDLSKIKLISNCIIEATKKYLDGFPSDAYYTFEVVMDNLVDTPLKVYQKSVMEPIEHPGRDSLKLFRVANVYDEEGPYPRKRIFHTPYNLRSKIATCRYSIAGYPCLYLGTSLELCCNEIKTDFGREENKYITAAYKLVRSYQYAEANIRVIELGIKPQDFIPEEYNSNDTADRNQISGRSVPGHILREAEVRSAYLLWYPLIAACSFVRANKNDPFAPEYIIPQLLMQWVRKELASVNANRTNDLIGIRYFSCASEEASDQGFNYVFPTSGQQKSKTFPYCSALTKAFRLTLPVIIPDEANIICCEHHLRSLDDYEYDHPDM